MAPTTFSATGRGALPDSPGGFPSPFADVASLAMPRNIADALRWCEAIISKNGPYRAAIDRVISYFLTDVEILSPKGSSEQRVGREEKQKYVDFLNDTIGVRDVLHTVALDFLTYGNSFTTVIVPFRRYLSCQGSSCGREAPLRTIAHDSRYNFRWSDFKFHATCPSCGYSGVWRHIDRRSGEKGEITIRRWSPHEIEIKPDHYTQYAAYIWKIPDDYRDDIRKGHLHVLERAPWEVVEAVKTNQNILFDDDAIYHMREDGLAGYDARGWGISRVLTNFAFAYLAQTLWRQTEAIAQDFITPVRVVTPADRGGGGEHTDPMLNINLAGFKNQVERMLMQHRADPARWNVLPYTLDYKTLGGDAANFAPHDLLKLAHTTLLDAIGVPQQFYSGDLSMQTAPAAMRLFEASWSHLTHRLNKFLSVVVEKIGQLMSWEPVKVRLQRVTHADDLNRQMAKMQLMMSGKISNTTGLSTVNLDFEEEERRKLEEQRLSAEAAKDMEEEMNQSAQMDEMAAGVPPGGMPPGGMPPGGAPGGQMPMMQGMVGAMPGGGMPAPAAGGGGAPAAQQFMAQQPTQPNVPQTPEEMLAKATTLAQQIRMMPETQRQSYLINLKRTDPTIHALVSSLLEDMRNQDEMRGRALIEQQELGLAAA